MEEEGFVESEAEESSEGTSGEEDSDDEEEEGEDEQAEVADLINDELEEEGGGAEEEDSEDSDSERKRKRKRKNIDDQLEEEDYDLIAENTGIQIQRKKFRRVRQLASDEEDEDEEGVAGAGLGKEEVAASRRSREMEDLSHEVFGDSDDEDLPDTQILEKLSRPQEKRAPQVPARDSEGEEEERASGSDDDVDDFIVGYDGQPIRRKKGDDYSEPALLEAQEIFGLDFDPAEFDQLGRDGLGSDEEGEEYESEGEEQSEGDSVVHERRKRRLHKSKKKTSIYDVYEPSELERGHFTERDSEIRVTDMPERFQVRAIPVQRTDEGELDEEAEWIFQQAFCKAPITKQPYYVADKHRSGPQRVAYGKPQSAVPKIKEALNFMRNHFFEVPFIANYRREYVEPELDIFDLWKIWTWDEKWMQLRLRKQNMRQLFERMQRYQFEKVREQPDKALTEDTRALQDDDVQRLEAVQTEEELSDVYAHFLLYYGRDLVAMRNRGAGRAKGAEAEGEEAGLDGEGKDKPKTTVKQAHRRDFYAICQENGLGSLAAKFGLTPEQFGENLRDNYQRHETEQHQVEPEEAAEDYVQPTGFFSSVRSVLQGACHMVAMQIACEPLVRQALRQVFQSRAVMCVRPTKKGKKMIDDAHPCHSMKYLHNKPVRDLKGDEALRLVQASEDHLLDIKISVDLDQVSDKRTTIQTYFEEIRQLFYRDEFSLLVEKWNAQRAQAVAHALLKVLYPLMEKELRNKLLAEAKEHVLQSCVHKFRKWTDQSPLQVKREDDSFNHDEGSYARVVACAYTPDRSVPAFCCFLDGSGEVVDFLRLNDLLKRRLSPMEKEREDKEATLTLFKRFVEQRKPDVVVVAAESREAVTIVDEFKLCLSELEQEEAMGMIPVELMDPNVARIYSKSRRAKEEFSEYPELLRMAVSLGRRMQEPLHEFSSLLLSQENEIFSLRMHLLQDLLPKDQLRSALEVELVTKVNQVGVDVNFCLEHPHAVGMLNFVCGLGPRKAAALLKILKQENAQLQNRSQLVTQCSIGPQVFINCAGFIRINTTAFSEIDNTYIEVLDSTRVHPETYEWARKMAVDALEYDETGDESNPSAAVEEILVTPDKLRDLDLDAFAEELERQDYGNKRTTLYDIRDELFGPYKERRSLYVSLTAEEKFILLTGETPDSLYEGKLIVCTVVGIVRRKPTKEVLERANSIKNEATGYWSCPFCLKSDFRDLSMVWQHFDDGSCPGQSIGVRTRLENGLSGFILTRNISDKSVNAPEERVHIGMTIHCRILRVNLDKFSVDLTCRSSDLTDREGKFSLPKDTYYDHSQSDADQRKEEASQNQPKQKYVKRVIVHPSFMNMAFGEVEKALAKMEQGEAIFRPSSKGQDHLTVTWKVDEGIHQHVDIREQGKPNPYSLGKSLLIGNDEYEDLDEILARYIQPLAAYARDLLTHKCYRAANGGERKELEKLLIAEKAKNPKRIPYFFSASKQLPGKFILGYQPNNKPFLEHFSVTPDGFRYRNQVHGSVNELIKWFKAHYREPIPRPIPSHVPSHVMAASQNVDPSLFSNLQAAVNTVQQQRSGGGGGSTGNTPYTPSQWANTTPTPQYGQPQQQTSYSHQYGYGYQQGQPYGHGGSQQHYSHGHSGQSGHYQAGYQQQHHRAGWNPPPAGWTPSPASHTPSQTPGRTPAYTPTQTPRSWSSQQGTPQHPSRVVGVGPGAGPHRSPYHRRPISPLGTPVMDE